MESDAIQFVRSTALVLENELNPIRERAARVEQWLNASPLWSPVDASALQDRIDELRRLGLKSFDALHLATAEQAGASLFVSSDDRLLNAAARRTDNRGTRCCALIDCMKEIIA